MPASSRSASSTRRYARCLSVAGAGLAGGAGGGLLAAHRDAARIIPPTAQPYHHGNPNHQALGPTQRRDDDRRDSRRRPALVGQQWAELEAARARGRKGGRKFALSKAQVRLAQAAMAHRDTSVSVLCRELGISPVTLYRVRRTAGPAARAGPEGSRLLMNSGLSPA